MQLTPSASFRQNSFNFLAPGYLPLNPTMATSNPPPASPTLPFPPDDPALFSFFFSASFFSATAPDEPTLLPTRTTPLIARDSTGAPDESRAMSGVMRVGRSVGSS